MTKKHLSFRPLPDKGIWWLLWVNSHVVPRPIIRRIRVLLDRWAVTYGAARNTMTLLTVLKALNPPLYSTSWTGVRITALLYNVSLNGKSIKTVGVRLRRVNRIHRRGQFSIASDFTSSLRIYYQALQGELMCDHVRIINVLCTNFDALSLTRKFTQNIVINKLYNS